MAIESQKLYEFKKNLRRLRGYHGSGTEMISVYISAGAPLHDTSGKLREEMSQASNIKSKSTKLNVTGALERIIGYLKMFKSTPKNGIAIFCGNIGDNAAKIEIELTAIEPPMPLNVSAYRCDSKFFLDPLDDMVETKEAYGLVVMDGRECTLALLRGKNTEIVKKLVSLAHAKVNKGGQCLSPGTLVQKGDGEICEIKDLKAGDLLKALDMKKNIVRDFVCSDIFKTSSKCHHIIKTNAPSTEIKATPYHRFLVVSEFGAKEKYAKDLTKNDKLLMARKITHLGKPVQLQVPVKNYHKNAGNCSFPGFFNEEFAYLLGVICGDGTLDGNRLIIYEESMEMAGKYRSAFRNLLKIEPVVKTVDKTKQKGSFSKKPYYEIRLYSLRLADFIASQCPHVIDKSEGRYIPPQILKSENPVLAGFLRGLFDAEGYLDSKMARIAGTSRKLIQQCSIALLRFGIISAFSGKKAQYNKQWQVTISDQKSLSNFRKHIGFSRSDKAEKLDLICANMAKSQQYSDQVPFHGRQVYNLIKSAGLKSRDFGAPDFFLDKKCMGREVFKRGIISRLEKLKGTRHEWIFSLFKEVYEGDVCIAKVSENKLIEEQSDFYDLTIPESANFMANGLIVHNSQRRFQRLVEESIEYYYKRIGEAINEHFLGKVKGIIVGGPGPAKDYFVKANTMNYQIKLLGVVDTGYTDEYGIREVLAKSENIISEQESVREKQLIDNFIKEISRNGLASYGYKEVKHAIVSAQAGKVLVSEELQEKIYFYACNCGENHEVISKEKPSERLACPKCGNEEGLRLKETKLLVDYLLELARDHNIDIEMISDKTTEGAQFHSGFGGIGALLRYKK